MMHLLPYRLLILLSLGIAQQGLSQEFLHDSILVTGTSINSYFTLGVSTPEDVLVHFPTAKVKVEKYGHKDYGGRSKRVYIHLKKEGLKFMFYYADQHEIRKNKLRSTIESILIQKDSPYCLNHNLCGSSTHQQIKEDYYEANKEDIELMKEYQVESSFTNEYYLNSGFMVDYISKDKSSPITFILLSESKLTQDRNQEIYYEWKHLQDSIQATQQIFQQVLDVDILEPYYHHKLNERMPVKLCSNSLIPEEVQLEKFDQPVFIYPAPSISPDASSASLDYAIHVLDYKKNDTEALVHLMYPAEGIRLQLHLAFTDNAWKITDKKLQEF